MRLSLLLALFALALSAPASAQQWIGGDGDWFDASNWSPAQVPGEFGRAIIASGNPVISRDTTLRTLILAGGSLKGDGHLTISDSLYWRGGTLDGRNDAETAAITIGPLATMLISGDEMKGLRGRDIFNEGRIIWTGEGAIELQWTTTLHNRLGATIRMLGDADLTRSNGTLDLINDGLLMKSTGTGVSGFYYGFGSFQNRGDVRIETGTLDFGLATSAFLGSGDGDFEVLPGAALQFGNGRHRYDPGSQLSCSGTCRILNQSVDLGSIDLRPGARLDVSGGELTTQSGSFRGTVVIDGGTLLVDGGTGTFTGFFALQSGGIGGNGTLNLTTPFFWTGGRLGSGIGGTINLQADVTADGNEDNGDAVKEWGSGLISNAGTFRWLDGDLVLTGSLEFINEAESTFSIESDRQWRRTNGFVRFSNDGEIVKSGTDGQTTLIMPFAPLNNNGEIRVESGTLLVGISGSGARSTDTGIWEIAEGATLRFDNHRRTFAAESEMRGTGTVRFTGGTQEMSGILAPGASPGVLTVDSDWPAMEPDGVLEIEIGGMTPGTEYDQLAVTGDAMLGGTLRVVLTDGFAPEVGDRFLVVPAASVSGAFDTLDLPDGLAAFVESTAQGAELVIGTPVSQETPPSETPLPEVVALYPPAPNPVSSRAALRFDLPSASETRLEVYDTLGRRVAVLANGSLPPGTHEARLDASVLAPGTYVVRLSTERDRLAQPLVIVR